RRELRQELVFGQDDRRRRERIVLEQRRAAHIGEMAAVETRVEHDKATRRFQEISANRDGQYDIAPQPAGAAGLPNDLESAEKYVQLSYVGHWFPPTPLEPDSTKSNQAR